MQPFHLNFAAPGHNLTGNILTTPPGFRLDPPEAGWIFCHIEGADFLPIRMSNVHPPLADLWLWSVAVARGLLPVTVRIAEEGTEVLFAAEELPEGRLHLSLIRREDTRYSFEPGRVIDAITWTEDKRAFLARWGALWATYCLDDTLPWDEWERFEEKRFPEPMRDMPWGELAYIPELEAPPWSLPQRIAWFYLSMAHHRSPMPTGHGYAYVEEPDWWTLHRMAFAELSLIAAHAAWRALCEGIPPTADAWQQIQKAREMVENYRENREAHSLPFMPTFSVPVRTVHLAVHEATMGCLARLPIGAGSFFAGQEGHRAVLIDAKGRDWLLYWDDGHITREDAFHTIGPFPCRWPVATGPHFDRNTLDPIDARRLRFLEIDVSPVNIVCPVCGYPCMDDHWAEVEYCEFCGFTLYKYDGNSPLSDLETQEDGSGNRLRRTLRQYRENFLRWGDVLPPGFPRRKLGRWRKVMLTRTYRRLACEAMVEWDAWLENPDPAHTPEEVWRRWNRWRGIE